MSTVRVAAVQLAVGTDVDDNLATCLRMLDEAARHRPDVVVLPEFCNHISWYDSADAALAVAQDVDGPFAKAIAAKAAEIDAWVMVNLTVRRDDDRVTGTNLLFDRSGTLVATSDKQVLMGAENDHLSPATDNGPVVATPFGPVGMYSCMDGVINETPRGLAVRGARLLLNSLNSFALDEASLHVPVRAAENKVFVVAANKVGPLVPLDRIDAVSAVVGVPAALLHGAGESQVVAPDGTVLAKGPRTGEAVVVADIDLEAAADKRRPDGTDVMAARRPALYAPIAAPPVASAATSGADDLVAAAVQLSADGAAAIPEAADTVAALARDGVGLIVLPELFCFHGGVLADADPAVAQRAVVALQEAVRGTAAYIVCSLPDDGAHVGLVISAAGVVAEQPQLQLHRSDRHASWVTQLGDRVVVVELPWGRLAVLVGDDAVYPEAFRLAALQHAEVVAVPMHVAERWELETGLVERAAENRVNVVAASRPTPVGASCVVALSSDFTLWTPWQTPFAGNINYPEVTRADLAPGVTRVVVHPAYAANRFVSRRTDVVDSRPWRLASVLTT